MRRLRTDKRVSQQFLSGLTDTGSVEKPGNGMDFETTSIREGRAEIIVPKPDYYRVSPNEYVPSKAPVFYNPLMKENRDFTVMVASVIRRRVGYSLCFGDSMAGVGVRSIRVVTEAGWNEAYVNDSSQRAFATIVMNIRLNRLEERLHASKMDANVFHVEHSPRGSWFDMLELDPFGTPVRFLDTCFQAVKHGGVLSVTATDTANLFGVHKRAARMLYGVNVLKTGFMREIGVRVLLKAVAEAAARNERGIEPIVSVTRRHYVKVLVRVLKGRKHAFKSVSQIRFLKLRRVEKIYVPLGVVDVEEGCEKDSLLLGPLYTGQTYSREWLEKMLLLKTENTFADKDVFKTLETLVSDDQKIVGGIDLTGLASSLHVNPPGRSLIIERLAREGFTACRSGFDNNCVRTDAGLEELVRIIRSL
ncbi:MAG: hypothetical protein FGF53_02120 [Candidatus Brockarchaeota archaeon]|nr:hypothetical protein [Candidatus Brockarchaeota archaeon]